ncbi:MAG: hypothetical protein AAFN70_04975, partial [Planctomycetota bacterium]
MTTQRFVRFLGLLTLFIVAVSTVRAARAQFAVAKSDSTTAVTSNKQIYEIRTYRIGKQGDEAAVDTFLQRALVPALNRQGVSTVGVFFDPKAGEGDKSIFVVIPYDSMNAVLQTTRAVETDARYIQDAGDYLMRDNRNMAFARVESELLEAFDCMPELKVPEGTQDNEERVYELRVYESASEGKGIRKVEMFNSGEVPIFLDSGVQPIFFGRAIIGRQTPSLTYLTVYKN